MSDSPLTCPDGPPPGPGKPRHLARVRHRNRDSRGGHNRPATRRRHCGGRGIGHPGPGGSRLPSTRRSPALQPTSQLRRRQAQHRASRQPRAENEGAGEVIQPMTRIISPGDLAAAGWLRGWWRSHPLGRRPIPRCSSPLRVHPAGAGRWHERRAEISGDCRAERIAADRNGKRWCWPMRAVQRALRGSDAAQS